MQEVMKDGSTGKLIVEDTLEALLPHIRKSLDNPKVNFVKVFKGAKIDLSKGPSTFEQKDTYAAEENKKDVMESFKEEIEKYVEEDAKELGKPYAPGFIKSIKPTKVRR